MPIANANGTEVYYESHGQGPAVLFIHGSGGNHLAWWQQVTYLSSWFTVLTLDLRGFGNSGPLGDDPQVADFVADIEAVLDASGVERCVLVGQSVGASAAMEVAMRRPSQIAGLVPINSLAGIVDSELKQLAQEARKASEATPIGDRLLTPKFRSARPDLTFLFELMGTFNQASIKNLRNLAETGPDVEAVIRSGVPVHFVSGEHDAMLGVEPVRRAQEKLDGAELHVLSGGAHSLYWELPDAFNVVIERILRSTFQRS